MKITGPAVNRNWRPVIAIDDQTQTALAALAARYFDPAKNTRRKLCVGAQAILEAKFPGRKIKVTDATDYLAKLRGAIQVLVSVDGRRDQGLIFHQAKPDGTINGEPAND